MRKILFILAFIPASLWAQDSKVSDLTATTSPDSSDLFYIVEGGVSKKIDWYYMSQSGFPVDVRTNAAGNILFESLWMGEDAGVNHTSGAYYNFGVGSRAQYALTSGTANTSLGYNSGYSLTTGAGNHFGGFQSGYGVDTARFNISLGYKSMYGANGYSNIALGYEAGYNVEGAYNVFAGFKAGYMSGAATSSNSVGIGYLSLSDLTTGSYNLGIGANAGDSLTTGGSSVFMGYKAGASAKTASYSVYVGASAGLYQDDDGNTAIGHRALEGTYGSSGTYGVAIGNQAGLVNNSTGSIFIGALAGDANTTGINTAIGYQALSAENTSGYNTIIGYQSATSADGITYSTTLGNKAGYTLSTGDYNTFLGAGAGYSMATGSRNIMIGYQAGYNETGSDKLYIDPSNTSEPLIEGDFSSNDVVINGDLEVTGDAGNLDVLSLTSTGEIGGLTDVTLDVTATVTLTAADCDNAIRFNNDADVIQYDLPAASAGLVVMFYDIGGGVISINPYDGTDTIYLNGSSVGAGDEIDSPGAVGDFIVLMAIDDTRWVTLGQNGTWVDGGAS